MNRPRYAYLSDPQTFDISDAEIETIRRKLAERTGFHLEGYKDKCVKRRITLRIRATHCKSAAEYTLLLQQEEMEVENLCRVLTIHVSHFFRNPSTFLKLEAELPLLFSRALDEKRESVTFWSVGCATGEEPYTLALILKDRFDYYLSKLRVRIIGTDLDGTVLDKARCGTYGTERLAEVPAEMLERYYYKSGNCFGLQREIRDMVEFSRSDLLADPPLVGCDLILCRNVLIYFERPQQEAILNSFASSLLDNGLLVLGKSEILVGEARKQFRTVCPTERIYRKLSQ